MKATLTFVLPREDTEYVAAAHGVELMLALHRVAEHIRGRLKHGELGEACEELEAVRAALAEDLADLPAGLRP